MPVKPKQDLREPIAQTLNAIDEIKLILGAIEKEDDRRAAERAASEKFKKEMEHG